MDYVDIQDEIINLRFNSTKRPSVKRWIDAKYAEVWAAYDWPFKFASGDPFDVAAGDARVTMSDTFHKMSPQGFVDENGNVLRFLDQRMFFSAYAASTDEGHPDTFTIVNNEVLFAPISDAAYTYFISYERRISHLDSTGSAIGGPMTEDDDTPIWSDDFHFLLVPGAMALGLKLENDPTWPALEQEFLTQIGRMADHYLPPDIAETQQYGADTLGYETVI